MLFLITICEMAMHLTEWTEQNKLCTNKITFSLNLQYIQQQKKNTILCPATNNITLQITNRIQLQKEGNVIFYSSYEN